MSCTKPFMKIPLANFTGRYFTAFLVAFDVSSAAFFDQSFVSSTAFFKSSAGAGQARATKATAQSAPRIFFTVDSPVCIGPVERGFRGIRESSLFAHDQPAPLRP